MQEDVHEISSRAAEGISASLAELNTSLERALATFKAEPSKMYQDDPRLSLGDTSK